MAMRGTGTATMSGMSMDILLGVGFDSDDEEDGGTPLNQLDPANQSLVNANNRARGRNGNQLNGSGRRARRRQNSFRPIPGNKLNASHILDWLLGRHVHLTSEDVANDSDHREWETGFCIDDDFLDIGDVKDICPACTTPYCQAIDSIPFESGLKLTYNDIMSHKWLIGNKYVLHEAIDGHPEDDYVPLVEAARALKTLAPKVPMPKVRAGWKENGKVITISDTVPGDRLYDIWWDLSREERESIAEQVAEHIDSWRECDLGRISNLVGDAVHHHDNLFGATEAGFGPFGSDLEFWLAIEQRLRKKGVDEDTIQLLKDRMPPSSPCVFTHGDVSSTNIIVHRGTVTGILGFENAASLPSWAENVAMHFCYCAEDEQWKGLLSKHIRSYREALDWWSLWTAVEDTDTNTNSKSGSSGAKGSSHARVEGLKARCRRWDLTEITGQPYWSIWLGHEDGAVRRRLNIQRGENEPEMRVGDLVRQSMVPDLLRGRYDQALSDSSWGPSSDDYDGYDDGGDDDKAGKGEDADGVPVKSPVRKRDRGLAEYHSAQQQHYSLVTSASGASRTGDVAGHTRSSAQTGAGDFSDAESESGVRFSLPLRPASRDKDKAGPSESVAKSKMKGLRPLSLVTFALSEGARGGLRSDGDGDGYAEMTASTPREEAARMLGTIREGGAPQQSEAGPPSSARTSMFGNKVAPGSLYAALSAASVEARSEERTRRENGRPDGSRPQSMMQPYSPSLLRHEGVQGQGKGKDGEEKHGYG